LTPRDVLHYIIYMPIRKTPLVSNEIYHVFNKSLDGRHIFIDKKSLQRAFLCMQYYQRSTPPLKFSHFLQLSKDYQEKILQNIKSDKSLNIEFLAFCFMPSHFHFLIKQVSENGISRFTSNFINSYTRYFNTRHDRNGHLFQGQFKAVHVEDDDQLLHISRYIHLNPYSSHLVKNIDDLVKYPWSSYTEYLEGGEVCAGKDMILDQFNNSNDYELFVKDHSDYQRNLESIKHLALD